MTKEEAPSDIVLSLNEDADCCDNPDIEVMLCKVISDEGYIIQSSCNNCRDRKKEKYEITDEGLRFLYCTRCNGTGKVTNIVGDFKSCSECGGSGWVWNQKIRMSKRKLWLKSVRGFGCNYCEGGKQYDMYYVPDGPDDKDGGVYKCDNCNGIGFTIKSVINGFKEFISSD
jgi:RecJ-like exonuclease